MFNLARIAIALACLSLAAHAQTAGTYTTFGTSCQGSNNATPALSNAGVPEIGKSFRVEVSNARASTGAGLITGSSTTAWGPLQLPADLRLIGANGCTLYVAFESLVPFATGCHRQRWNLRNDSQRQCTGRRTIPSADRHPRRGSQREQPRLEQRRHRIHRRLTAASRPLKTRVPRTAIAYIVGMRPERTTGTTGQATHRSASATEMRAIVQARYGGPEMLAVERVAVPHPGPGELLVQMQAASVTRGDWHVLRGWPYLVRAVFGLRRPRQPVPGMYASGLVVARGEGVTSYDVGDPVFGSCQGAFAELVRMKEDAITTKPASTSHSQAAASLHGGFTALQALRDKGNVQEGHEVLLIGAAGAVGCFAIQLAKLMKARVTAVCRGEHGEFVMDLGADRVVDYTKTTFAADAAEQGITYDLILDLYGGHAFGDFRKALRPRGRAVLVATGHGGWTGSMHRALRAALTAPFKRKKVLPFLSQPRRDDLRELRDKMGSGELRVPIAREYPLTRVAEAFRDLEAKKQLGLRALVANGS